MLSACVPRDRFRRYVKTYLFHRVFITQNSGISAHQHPKLTTGRMPAAREGYLLQQHPVKRQSTEALVQAPSPARGEHAIALQRRRRTNTTTNSGSHLESG